MYVFCNVSQIFTFDISLISLFTFTEIKYKYVTQITYVPQLEIRVKKIRQFNVISKEIVVLADLLLKLIVF